MYGNTGAEMAYVNEQVYRQGSSVLLCATAIFLVGTLGHTARGSPIVQNELLDNALFHLTVLQGEKYPMSNFTVQSPRNIMLSRLSLLPVIRILVFSDLLGKR